MDFYCTCGRGTEKFAHRELLHLFGRSILAEKIVVTDGKVYFSLTPSCARDIFQLKSVERIFVKVLHCTTDNLDRRNPISLVMKLIPGQLTWCRAFATWKSLQDFTTAKSPPGKRRRVKENSMDMKFSPYSNSCPQQIIDGDKLGSHKDEISVNSKDENTSSCYSDTDVLYSDSCDNTNSDSNSQYEVSKLYDNDWIDKRLTFRINMKATGNMGKSRNNQILVKEIAKKVCQFLDIDVSLRNPDLEICIHLNDNFLTIGIPITRQPLSKRKYILHNGLRSTVSWIMADLCAIKAGEMVLDPMCGKGSILIEAAKTNQTACFLGADFNQDQLKFARTNVDFAGTNRNVHIIQANALNLPLSDSILDCIVTDAPFGINHTTQLADLKTFYCSLLLEASRLLKNGGRAVMLTSFELKNFIEKYLADLHQTNEPGFTLESNSIIQDPSAKADFTAESNSIIQDPSAKILCFSLYKSNLEDLPQSRHVSDTNNSLITKAETGKDEIKSFRTSTESACTENSKEKCFGSKRDFNDLEVEKSGGQFAELWSYYLLKDAKETKKYDEECGGNTVDDLSKIKELFHDHDNCYGGVTRADSLHPSVETCKGIEKFCSVNNPVRVCTLFMKDRHYIKLGEVDSFILELQNRK